MADKESHRILRWRPNAREGDIVADGKGQGSRTDQLNQPHAVLLDRLNNGLIISEHGNRRVIRWFLPKDKQKRDENEVIISNILCLGWAMDDEGALYVSDFERNEVRRYGRRDGRGGVIVAGGHGRGPALNQLDCPRQISVDAECCVYVSDSLNHRVMKWTTGAKEDVVVAGGQGEGNRLGQLQRPSGIFVDQMGSVYVADQENHRVMLWKKGAKEGEVIVGGNGRGVQNNQLNRPGSILLDDQKNLYVVDRDNNRVQCV